jgi:hypothetical protein
MCYGRVIPNNAANSPYRSNGGHWPELTLNGLVAGADGGQALMTLAA